jgi:hypothetical protein
MRAVRVVTTLPLFAGAVVAWWFGYTAIALLSGAGGALLAALQWMTVRALQHNSGSVADHKRGPV